MYCTVHSLELLIHPVILASGNKSSEQDSYSLSNTGYTKPAYAQWSLSVVSSRRIQVDVVTPEKTSYLTRQGQTTKDRIPHYGILLGQTKP